MNTPRRRGFPGGMLGILLLAGCAADVPQAPPTPDLVPSPGLFTLSPGTPVDGTLRVSLARGATSAQGVLETNGQRVRFSIAGLAAAQGPRRVEVSGRVYGLQRVSDFAGTYRDVSGAAGDLGGALRIGNDNLVLIELRGTPATALLAVPQQGATVALLP